MATLTLASDDALLWRPRSQADLAPSGEKAKAKANLTALRTLRAIQATGRPATPGEAADMARWAGWGAIPAIFDDAASSWATERNELRRLLVDEATWDAARATVLNAHYTSAEVVQAMWLTVTALGFSGGTVLEPGCGSGNFFGLAPDLPISFTGIELDPITAAIAAAIYPDVDVRHEGFQDSRLEPDSFDAVMGNVPFAKLALHDPHYNRARHSIHNHFIIKALHMLRPGGIAMLLTSRYTLDSRNPAARREIAELADLVGAIRLPEGAFQASAGTRVIEDMLILRRRPGAPSRFATPWASLATISVDVGESPTTEVNEYFATNPQRMIGTPSTDRGMYGRDEFTLTAGDEPLALAMADALGEIVEEATDRDLCWIAPPLRSVKTRAAFERDLRRTVKAPAKPPAIRRTTVPGRYLVEVPPPPRKEGTILATDGRTGFGRVHYGTIVDYEPSPKSDTGELGLLVRLRDILAGLLDAQAGSGDDEVFSGLQSLLNLVYDQYVAAYGPISRFTERPNGRTTHECDRCGYEWQLSSKESPTHCKRCRELYRGAGEQNRSRIRPRLGGFRRLDPDFPALLALEVFDPDTQTATKAPIFSKRVVAPRVRHTTAATAQDALSLCLDMTGEVHLDVIAKLLGCDVGEAAARLGTLVWENPDTEEVEPAARYLSGNVRQKLHRARMAAQRDERFLANVEALEAVMPEDLGPTEIDARLGCTWISPEILAAFAKQVLGARDPVIHHTAVTATWQVQIPRWQRNTVAMSSTFGTGRCDAADLMQFSANQQPAAVYDTIPKDGGGTMSVLNHAETASAREKQEALEARFSEWVWEDHDRAIALCRIYNERFNCLVTPDYDGSHLSLPGASTHLTPHPHQLNSVWRIIQDATVGLFQPVGSGKTFTMAAGGMELRRLGLVSKPIYVVPNHMLHQFCAEFLQIYPRARVLLATKEQTEAKHRKEFVARCAMGDWDAIIITRSAFERIPVSNKTKAEFIALKIAALTKAIQQSDDNRFSVKRLELQRQKLTERHTRLLAAERKDDGVTFEATGIDYIFADEAHGYKNMAFPTHMQSVGGEGSQRAEDMELKIHYLRTQHGERVCTLATATPVANSLAEIFVMQRFLQPDALVDAHIFEFDAWAATFGQTVNQLELAPDGTSYRVGSRFARFRNVPDLMRIFRAVADVRTPDELASVLKVPLIVGGEATIVVVPSSGAHKAYMAHLAHRAEQVRAKAVNPKVDNMLKVSTDGRKAALHLRLVDPNTDLGPIFSEADLYEPDKVLAAAEHIASIYRETRDTPFLDDAGNIAARRGGFQLVFCDLGTPHGDGRFSVYVELRAHLVRMGLPADSVRFIHDAADDRRKAEMFAACRDGRVAVLVASTEKAGVGTNIQARMVALHHLDCPWRPCDIEQREGRGLRQGNQNAYISIIRYVTEQTFDTYLWQTVARKAAFIHQVMSGKFRGREVDDLGEQALSYAEVKALATGNPLIMEQAGVDTEVARLTRSRRAHHQDQTRLGHLIESASAAMERCVADAAAYGEALGRRTNISGDAFYADIEGEHHTSRADAGRALQRAMVNGCGYASREGYTARLGTIGGQTIVGRWRRTDLGTAYASYRSTVLSVQLSLKGVPGAAWNWDEGEITRSDPCGIIRSFEHRMERFEHARTLALADHDRHQAEQAAARARLGQPFPNEDELTRTLARQAAIAKELEHIADQQREAKEKGAAA